MSDQSPGDEQEPDQSEPVDEPKEPVEEEPVSVESGDVPRDAKGAEQPPKPARRILRPHEALDRLDLQWADLTPLRDRSHALSMLILTVDEDPHGFDYFGGLGVPPREAAGAYVAWLDAQLAADALELGRVLRPRVALVPAGRLWYVVRIVGGVLIAIDGPGYPSPGTAVLAARRRYRALMAAEVEAAPTGQADANDEAEEAAETSEEEPATEASAAEQSPAEAQEPAE